MVGIVTGNGLGLFNASQNLLGGFGASQGGSRVNVATGNLVVQGLDRTQSGVGIDLSALRTYNLQGSVGGADGWHWEGERRVQLVGTLSSSGSSVIRTAADGHETVFSWNGTAYVSTEGEGAHDSLTWDSGNSQWVWTDGNSRAADRYDSNGRLVSLTDASGNVQSFAYDGSGRLASVTDVDSDQQIVFVYDGSGRLERLDTRTSSGGSLTQRVYYSYDGSGRLSSVKTDLTPSDNSIADNAVYTTTYTYDSTSLRIASITQGDGTTVSFTYTQVGSDYRVATVTDAAGTTSFSYDTTNRVTTITNGASQAWEYSYDSSDRLLEVRTPAIGGQRQITTYTWDGDGNVSSVSDGLGRTVTYTYDSAGNLTLERDELGNTVVRSYTATNQLQNEIRYTSPSTESGGVWTLPANSTALTTRYVYDSNDRLRFTVSAEGRVSEFRYNGDGRITHEIRYTVDSYSLSGLNPTDTLSLSNLTSWQPTTAAQTQSVLTYDYRGNVQQRTSYATVDSSGVGVLDAATTITKYVYSESGQLLQTLAVTGSGRTTETTQTSYVYDGAGRLASEVSAAGTRTWTYDASARTTTISQTIGTASRTSVTTQDSVGRITSQVEAATSLASRSTSYVYDAAGRLAMQENAAGARSYFFYDAASRLVGQVDALGGVTETVYNAAGQITSEIRYATRVNTSGWYSGGVVTQTSLAAIRPSTTGDDRTVGFTYDDAGRRTVITDAGGVTSTTTYDAAGRVVKTQTGSGTVRTTRFFHDKDGRLLAQLDGEGYLVRHTYNAAGQLQQSIRYASVTGSGVRASGSLDDLMGSLANTSGLSTWFFYDAQNRQIGSVDEQQFVIATVYNDEARTQQTVRYLSAYTSTITTSTAFSTITTALASSATYTTSTQFDTQNRVSTRTAADGTVTAYEYDTYNRLVKETAASGGSEAREKHYRYDAYGQVISTLWGEGVTHLSGGMTESQIATVHATYGEQYSYDVLGRRAQNTDRAGNVTTYYYDDLGQLTHVINARGDIVETSYSTFGQVTETRSYDNSFSETAGSLGSGGTMGSTLKALVEGIRDANYDRRTQNTYNTRGLLTQRTDAEGFRTQYTYNDFGNVATRLREQSTGVFATDAYTYSLRGEQLTEARDTTGLNVGSSVAYDAFGRVISRTNELGKTTGTAYTDAGRTVTETDPLSHTRSRTYDALGRVLTVTDGTGQTTTYAYNDSTRTTTVTTPEGVVTETVLTEHGQTFTVEDGNGNLTTYAYNLNGDLLTTEDATTTTVITHAYDDAGRLESSTDARGAEITTTYDALNRVLTRTHVATGNTTVYAYDAHGSQVTVTEADGTAQERVTQYSYDRNGAVLTATVDPSGLALKTTYTYDGEGRQLTVAQGTTASPSQQVTAFAYDKLGRATTQTRDPGGLAQLTQYFYDAAGRLTRTIDADGASSWTLYDDAGRVTHTVNALGEVIAYGYDNADRVIVTTAYATRIATGSFGNVVSSVTVTADAAQDRVTRSVLDDDGRVQYTVQVVDGDAVDTITGRDYDAAGRVVTEYVFAANATTFTETALDTLLGAATDVRTTRYVYDAVGRLRYTINAQNRVLEQVWDALGGLSETRQYENAITVPGTITAGTVATAVAATNSGSNIRSTRVVRDAAGRERFVIDALGNVSEKIYNALNQVVAERQYAPSSALSFGDYSDAAVASAVSALSGSQVQTSRFAYDAAGRLRYTVDALGYLSASRYDARGNVLAQIRYGAPVSGAISPSTLTLTESALDTEAAAQTQQRATRYVYDASGALHYSIDALGFVTAQVRDARGQVLRETRYGTAVSLSGDPTEAAVASAISALSGRSTHYRYDAAGNATVTVDALNFVTRRVFDAYGNVTSETKHATALASAPSDGTSLATLNGLIDALATTGNRTTEWAYNSLNQLITQTSPSAVFTITISSAPVAVAGVLKTRFTYDNFGNLATRSEGEVVGNRVDNSSAVTDTAAVRTTTFVYDILGRQTQSIAPGWYDTTDGKFYKEQESQSDRFQVVTEVQYDGFGNAVLQKVKTGLSTWAESRKVYDVLNRVRYDLDALGYVTKNSYDGFGNETGVTRYNTAVTNLTPGGSRPYLTEADMADGRLATHADDRTLTMAYDALNRKTGVTQPTVAVYVYGGDAGSPGSGLVSVVSGLDGSAVQGYANVTTSTTTGAPAVTWTYNAFGEQVKEVVAGGPTTFNYYDALGRKTAMVDAGGYYTAFTYFAESAQISLQTEYATAISLTGVTEASVPTAPATSGNDRVLKYTWNNLLQLTKTERLSAVWWLANSGQTAYTQQTTDLALSQNAYNAFGEAVQTTDAAGNVTTLQYDGLGHVTQVTEPVRRTARADGEDAIDPFWSIQTGGVTVYDNRFSASPVISLVYDQFGQTVEQTRAAASGQAGVLQVSSTTYDHAGNVIALEDAGGGVKTYKVDAQGRTLEEQQVVNQNYAQWSGVETETQTHVRTYTYDVLGRQSSTDNGGSMWEVTAYNAFGEVKQKSLNGIAQEVVTYDKAGRVIQTVNANGTTSYDYDLAGRQTRTNQQGASGTTDDRITVSVVDALGRVTEQRLPKFDANLNSASDTSVGTTTVIPLLRQTFDRWGNVLTKIDARGNTTSWTYDADNRVLTETEAATSVLSETNTSSTLHQVHTLRYDALGNVAMQLDGTKTTGGTYTELRNRKSFYNEVGQLTKEVDATGIAREYAIDAHGNRVAIKDALGTVRYNTFDAMNRVTETGILRNETTSTGVAEGLVPVGDMALVATTSQTSYMVHPVTTPLSGGGYLLAWTEGGGDYYKAQRYDADGDAVGSVITLNSTSGAYSSTDSNAVSIAAVSGGGFVAVWAQTDDIYMRRFDADGVALAAAVRVNDTTTDYSTNVHRSPSVAMLTDGTFVVVWQSPKSSSASDVYVSRYSSTGTVLLADTKVNGTSSAVGPSVVALSSGKYAISYSNDGSAIRTRIYSSANVAGTELTASTHNVPTGVQSRMVVLSNGDILVAWKRANAEGLAVQTFNSAGSKVGSEVTIELADRAATLGEDFGLTALADGGYAIAYEVRSSSGNTAYIARYDRFHLATSARYALGNVTSSPTSNYMTASVATLANGNVLATIGGRYVDGSSTGKAFAQIFEAGNATHYNSYASGTDVADFVPGTGIDVTVNSGLTGTSNYARVTTLANGNFVAAWTLDDGSGWRARIYDSTGAAVTSELTLNTVTRSGSTETHNLDVEITALSGGGFVAVWTHNGDVYARRFSASGSALDTSEQMVNTTTTDYGDYIQRNASIGALSDGSYVIVWESPTASNSGNRVRYQRFNEDGTKNGSEVLVPWGGGGGSNSVAMSPQIFSLTNGNFIVSYYERSDGVVHVYTSSGTSIQYDESSTEPVRIAPLTGGGFVAIYEQSHNIKSKQYNNNGDLIETSDVFSGSTSDSPYSLDVVSTSDGGYVVGFVTTTGGMGAARNGYLRYFDAAGDALTDRVLINTVPSTQDLQIRLARMGNGDIAAIWSQAASGSTSAGVYARINDTVLVSDLSNYRPNVRQVALQSFQYDEAGQRYAEITGDTAEYAGERFGNVNYTRFDDRGNVIGTRNAAGVERTFTYDWANRKTGETDGNSKTLAWTYDDYGRMATKKDLADRVTNYTYTDFGQLWYETTTLATSTNAKVEYDPLSMTDSVVFFDGTGTAPALSDAVVYKVDDIVVEYHYYNNGMVNWVEADFALAGVSYDRHRTERSYDANGNLVRDLSTRKSSATGTSDDGTHDVQYRYDALGRLVDVYSVEGVTTMFYDASLVDITPRINSLEISYDAFGNRRRVNTSTHVVTGTNPTDDDWYKYDLEGRMLISEGMMVSSQIVAGKSGTKAKGVELAYDGIGRRVSEETWVGTTSVVGGSTNYEHFKVQVFTYNDLGNVLTLSDKHWLRASGGNSESALSAAGIQYYDTNSDVLTHSTTATTLRERSTYDLFGRKVTGEEFKRRGAALSNHRYFYQGDGQLVAQTDYDADTANIKTRLVFDETGMRDAAGNQLSYRYEATSDAGRQLNYEQTYRTTFVLFDGYKQAIQTVSKNGNTSGDGFGRTTFDYTGTGELVSAHATGGAPFQRHYSSNRFGQMITRTDRIDGSWKGQSHYYLNGSELVNVGQREGLQLKGVFESVSKMDLGNTPTSYTANQGDTAQTVAQAIYGDDTYAYLIADANAIADVTSAIAEGTTLLIPNVVANSYNAHDTVKPYNPSDVIGNTTPVPRPREPECNTVAVIIMTVVAILVTIAVSILVPPAAGPVAKAMGAIVSAAAGNAAGQVVGKELGVIEHFSLRDVASAALTAGLTQGVALGLDKLTKVVNPEGWVQAALSSTRDLLTSNASGFSPGSLASYAVKGTVNYGVNYVANELTGRDMHFTWEGLLASTVAAGAESGLAGTGIIGRYGAAVLGDSLAARVEDKWFGGARPDYAVVASSAIARTAGSIYKSGLELKARIEAEQLVLGKFSGRDDADAASSVMEMQNADELAFGSGLREEQVPSVVVSEGSQVVGGSDLNLGSTSELSDFDMSKVSGQERIQPMLANQVDQDGNIILRSSASENGAENPFLQISLDPSDINSIKKYLGNEDYAAAYRHIYGVSKSSGLVDEDTLYWFQQAASINSDENTPSNTWIREFSKAGIAVDGRIVSNGELQATSNHIARAVLGGIIDSGGIPPIQLILQRDIAQSLRAGGQTLGGWGGAFYYWDLPYEGTKTVGDVISSNPNELYKFQQAFIKAAFAMRDQHGLLDTLVAFASMPKKVSGVDALAALFAESKPDPSAVLRIIKPVGEVRTR